MTSIDLTPTSLDLSGVHMHTEDGTMRIDGIITAGSVAGGGSRAGVPLDNDSDNPFVPAQRFPSLIVEPAALAGATSMHTVHRIAAAMQSELTALVEKLTSDHLENLNDAVGFTVRHALERAAADLEKAAYMTRPECEPEAPEPTRPVEYQVFEVAGARREFVTSFGTDLAKARSFVGEQNARAFGVTYVVETVEV